MMMMLFSLAVAFQSRRDEGAMAWWLFDPDGSSGALQAVCSFCGEDVTWQDDVRD